MSEKKTESSVVIEKPENEKCVDNYNLVYIFFALFGVVQFLPATFFTTATSYWMYKFRDTRFDEVDSEHRTTLQVKFSPSVTIATHAAAITFSLLQLRYGPKISFKVRLYGSLLSVLLLYIFASILIDINTDSWQTAFFVLTMILIAAINGFNTISLLAFYAVIAKFPKKYLGSFLNGQGVAGIFTACLQVLSLAIGISTIKSAMVYFWIVVGALLSAIIFLTLLYKYNRFFNFYASLERDEKNTKEMRPMTLVEFFYVSKLLWKSIAILVFYLWTIYPTHPAVTSLVVSEGEGNGEWNDKYFTPVTTFLMTAIADFLGRQIPMHSKFFKGRNPIWYVLFSGLRVVIFVPLIFLCNAQPRSHLSVLFPHDYQYIIILMSLAFTNGFLLCIGQFIVPECVPPEKLERGFQVNLTMAGIIMGAFSFLGFVSVDLL